MLPFSLARLSEPTAPAFVRALLSVFFPATAAKYGLCRPTTVAVGPHWQAADEVLGQATAEAVCQFLGTALADKGEARQQQCHERLFRLAIQAAGNEAAEGHLKKVRAQNKVEHEDMLKRAAAAGKAPERESARKVTTDDKRVAEIIRQDSAKSKQCFSLGLIEECRLGEPEENAMLSQLVRLALSGHSSNPQSTCLVQWGSQCSCKNHDDHDSHCWWTVSEVYFFLEVYFFHLFIHQMWVEGAFNRLSANHDNSSPALMEAKLEARMNNPSSVMVASSEINRRIQESQKAKRDKKEDITERTGGIMEYMMKQPTKRRAEPLSTEEKARQQQEKDAAKLHKEEAAEAKRVQQQQEKEAKAAAKVAARQEKADKAAVQKEKEKTDKAAAAQKEKADKATQRKEKANEAARKKEKADQAAAQKDKGDKEKAQKEGVDKPVKSHQSRQPGSLIGLEHCWDCDTDVPEAEYSARGQCCQDKVACVERNRTKATKKRVKKTWSKYD
jgi:hypothetical protein